MLHKDFFLSAVAPFHVLTFLQHKGTHSEESRKLQRVIDCMPQKSYPNSWKIITSIYWLISCWAIWPNHASLLLIRPSDKLATFLRYSYCVTVGDSLTNAMPLRPTESQMTVIQNIYLAIWLPVGWRTDSLTGWLVGWQTDREADWPTDELTGHLSVCLNDWLMEGWTDGQIDGLPACLLIG